MLHWTSSSQGASTTNRMYVVGSTVTQRVECKVLQSSVKEGATHLSSQKLPESLIDSTMETDVHLIKEFGPQGSWNSEKGMQLRG